MGEVFLAKLLCGFLAASNAEVSRYFENQGERRSVRTDCETADFVFEVGLDNTSSNRDSIHQAVFAAIRTGKEPYVVLFDTDGIEGRYEQEMRLVTRRLGVRYATCNEAFIVRWAATAPWRSIGLDKSLDDLPQPAAGRGLCDIDLTLPVAN